MTEVKTLKETVQTLKNQIESSALTNEDVLKDLADKLSLDDGESNEKKANKFWGEIFATSQSLSKESTKVAMAYSKPPIPSGQEAAALLKGVETSAVALCSVYFNGLPTAHLVLGQLCWTGVRKWIIQVFGSLLNFIDTLKGGPSKVKSLLMSTGAVWEVCDSLQGLPKDNREALLKKLKEEEGIIEDALTELQDADSEDDDPMPAGLSQVLVNCLAICKTSKATLRTMKKALTAQLKPNSGGDFELGVGQRKLFPLAIVELDKIAETLEGFSPAVDEVAGGFYELAEGAPAETLEREVLGLVDLVKSALNCMKSCETWFGEKADEEKISFLVKAVDHNLKKFKTSLSNLADASDED